MENENWDFVELRGGTGLGTILGMVVSYMALMFICLYAFPKMAREAESGRRKRAKIFASPYRERDFIVHVVFFCSSVCVLLNLIALNLYLSSRMSEGGLLEIIKNPKTYPRIWCIGAITLLAFLAPFRIRNEVHGSPPVPLALDVQKSQEEEGKKEEEKKDEGKKEEL